MTVCDTIQTMVAEGSLNWKETANLMKLDNQHKNEICHYQKGEKEFYYTYVYVDGKRKRIDRKTKKALIEYLNQFYSNTHINDLTFSDVFELALENKKNTKAPNYDTLKKDLQHYKRFVNQSLANKKLKAIDDDYLNEYILHLLESMEVNKKLLSKIYSVFNLVFDYALRKEMISVDPRLGLNKDAFKKKTVVNVINPEDKAFQPKDIEILINDCKRRLKSKRHSLNASMVLFSTETGMRAGELCALKWDDIDFKKNRVWVHAQILPDKKNKTYYYAPWTKNETDHSGHGRYIVLTPLMREILDLRHSIQKDEGTHTPFIFNPLNKEYQNPDAYENSMWTNCTRLGLKKTNNHAIRIYFNSYVLVPKGFNVSERATYLGHSEAVNLKHYTFVDEIETFLEKAETRLVCGMPNQKPISLNLKKYKKRSLESFKFKTSQSVARGGFEHLQGYESPIKSGFLTSLFHKKRKSNIKVILI